MTIWRATTWRALIDGYWNGEQPPLLPSNVNNHPGINELPLDRRLDRRTRLRSGLLRMMLRQHHWKCAVDLLGLVMTPFQNSLQYIVWALQIVACTSLRANGRTLFMLCCSGSSDTQRPPFVVAWHYVTQNYGCSFTHTLRSSHNSFSVEIQFATLGQMLGCVGRCTDGAMTTAQSLRPVY
jgi:hypothetical protein